MQCRPSLQLPTHPEAPVSMKMWGRGVRPAGTWKRGRVLPHSGSQAQTALQLGCVVGGHPGGERDGFTLRWACSVHPVTAVSR